MRREEPVAVERGFLAGLATRTVAMLEYHFLLTTVPIFCYIYEVFEEESFILQLYSYP